MKKDSNMSVLLKGLLRENPVFVLILGTCPTLATTTTVVGAIGMGLATMAVLICSNIVISLLKTYIEENKISIETKNIENEINLTSILITQEGDVLFLFEVNWDIENGLCIKVIPEYDIGPQDVFL